MSISTAFNNRITFLHIIYLAARKHCRGRHCIIYLVCLYLPQKSGSVHNIKLYALLDRLVLAYVVYYKTVLLVYH